MYDRQVARRARAVGLVLLCLGTIAASADAATLKISVPRRLHKGRAYTISIDGTFKRDEVKGRAYLIAAIQFSSQPCQPTALLENNLPNQPQFYFGSRVGAYETHTPFSRSDELIARAAGPRQICAYLYPQFVGPTDTTQPIATADAAYRVFRRR
jgi:hypothetical protein